jgi:hypothetical protein
MPQGCAKKIQVQLLPADLSLKLRDPRLRAHQIVAWFAGSGLWGLDGLDLQGKRQKILPGTAAVPRPGFAARLIYMVPTVE